MTTCSCHADAGHPRASWAKVASVLAPNDYAEATDGELARAVAAGEGERAEAALALRFRRRVFLFGMRHLGDEAQADDLGQEVMATTITRLRNGEVRDMERIGSFILGMARWMVHTERRRDRRAREIAGAAAEELDTTVPGPEPPDLEALSNALAQLSERERAVVALSFVDDLSAQQIGETLGVRAGHVRVIRHRAIARLAAILEVSS